MEMESLLKKVQSQDEEIEKLQTEIRELTMRLINEKRDAFLSELIGKNQYSDDEFESMGAECGVSFCSDLFCVVLIEAEQLSNPLTDGGKQDEMRFQWFLFRNVLEELFGAKNMAYVGIHGGEQFCIVNILEPVDTAINSIRDNLQRTIELFEETYQIFASFTISQIHKGFRNIPECYEDAVSIRQYKNIVGDEARILFYDQFTENNLEKVRMDHFTLKNLLNNYITAGEYENAREVIHQMIQAEFNHTKPTIHIYMCRAYGLINDILYMLDELEESFDPEFLQVLQAGPRIVEAGSIQEIKRQLDLIFDELIEYRNSHKEEPFWFEKVDSFIQENLTNPNMDLNMIADAVGLDAGYLSRIYKRHRGIGVLETVHKLRIEMAKELLQSGITVKNTMRQVGYVSPLTMNRAFKKYEGVTPGAFYVPA